MVRVVPLTFPVPPPLLLLLPHAETTAATATRPMAAPIQRARKVSLLWIRQSGRGMLVLLTAERTPAQRLAAAGLPPPLYNSRLLTRRHRAKRTGRTSPLRSPAYPPSPQRRPPCAIA